MIYVEDQTIKLNGVVLPGLVKSIEVTESAKVDEQEVEGSATKPKQATGYEDAKVNIELIIDDTQSATKYQRYATLTNETKTAGKWGVNVRFTIVKNEGYEGEVSISGFGGAYE